MKTRRAGQVQRIGSAALAFSFVLGMLAGGGAFASDVERQIPATRDSAGSGLTMEISRDGDRQTATPVLTVYSPTVQRIEHRIAKKVAEIAAKEIPCEATVNDSLSRIGLVGTPQEGSRQPGATLASALPVPGEITIRTMKRFIKALRSSRNEKPAPAVVVPVPERRLGMADTSPR